MYDRARICERCVPPGRMRRLYGRPDAHRYEMAVTSGGFRFSLSEIRFGFALTSDCRFPS